MQWLEYRCERQLLKAEQDNLLRKRIPQTQVDGRHIDRQGRKLLQFISNDYLGLATQEPGLSDNLSSISSGAGASSLVSGYSPFHELFEQNISHYLGFDSALYFSSGFTANEATLSTCITSKDLVFGDRLNHASLIDGVRASRAKSIRYQHLDLDDLEHQLINTQIPLGGQRWIVTDAVFSMDGDIAPLPEIVQLAKKYGAALYVDDAHGFGVFGEGKGTLAAHGLNANDVDILMVTCGKAMGAAGACVLGKKYIIDFLVQSCRPYIYSTAPPSLILALACGKLESLINAHAQRQHLKKLSNFLYSELEARSQQGILQIQDNNHAVEGMHHPVHPLIVGEPEKAMTMSSYLRSYGITAGMIRPPTVPKGTSRLRISLSAAHQFEDVALLLQIIDQYYQVK